jgi:hypothetical protein
VGRPSSAVLALERSQNAPNITSTAALCARPPEFDGKYRKRTNCQCWGKGRSSRACSSDLRRRSPARGLDGVSARCGAARVRWLRVHYELLWHHNQCAGKSLAWGTPPVCLFDYVAQHLYKTGISRRVVADTCGSRCSACASVTRITGAVMRITPVLPLSSILRQKRQSTKCGLLYMVRPRGLSGSSNDYQMQRVGRSNTRTSENPWPRTGRDADRVGPSTSSLP